MQIGGIELSISVCEPLITGSMPQYMYHPLGCRGHITAALACCIGCGSDVEMLSQVVVHILGHAMSDYCDRVTCKSGVSSRAAPHLSDISPPKGALLHSLLGPSVAGTISMWLTNNTGSRDWLLPCHLISRLCSATYVVSK